MSGKTKIKQIAKKSFLYKLLSFYRRVKAQRKATSDEKIRLNQWYKEGQPPPPPHTYKLSVIKQYAAQFHLPILIETGTYLGETMASCKRLFKSLISIELDQRLYENARQKFEDNKHITIYNGDSGKVLKEILIDISRPCLFWLDGHYSEGFTAKGDLNTPIVDELKHIFNHHIKTHVILIDDARCFNGKDDYPTIEKLQALIKEQAPTLKFAVKNDIIRIHL